MLTTESQSDWEGYAVQHFNFTSLPGNHDIKRMNNNRALQQSKIDTSDLYQSSVSSNNRSTITITPLDGSAMSNDTVRECRSRNSYRSFSDYLIDFELKIIILS
jgi:hypothetical protein